MKIIKAHNVFAVLRGLLLLGFGVLQILSGIIAINPREVGEANPIGELFVTLFSAIGVIFIITGAITALYSALVFGNIKRTRRGISRGFIIVDILANIVAAVVGVVVLFSDGKDVNVYSALILFAFAVIGFAFDAVAYRAFKAVRGGSYAFEREVVRSRSFTALSVLGALFGIIPASAFLIFVVSMNKGAEESNYDMPSVYAALCAVCLTTVSLIAVSAASAKGKGGISAALLSLCAAVSAVMTVVALKNSPEIAIIACIGLALLVISGITVLAANSRRKREAERNARRYERDYMRAHRDR